MSLSRKRKIEILQKVIERLSEGRFMSSSHQKYHGLCSVIGDLYRHNMVAKQERMWFKELLNREYRDRDTFFNADGNEVSGERSTYLSYYIWHPLDKRGRLDWLNKVLNRLQTFQNRKEACLTLLKIVISFLFIVWLTIISCEKMQAQQSDRVTATVYNAVPEQTNNDPGHTASMFKLDLSNPYKHRIIAVSRDLLSEYPMGTLVRVSGTGIYDGIYVVEDKMARRWTKRIDILINVGMRLGKWNNVKITKI